MIDPLKHLFADLNQQIEEAGRPPKPEPAKVLSIHRETRIPTIESDKLVSKARYQELVAAENLLRAVAEILVRRDTLVAVLDAPQDDSFALSMIAVKMKAEAPDILEEVRSLLETARPDVYTGPTRKGSI